MQFTISVYDENNKCKVCGEHASKHHAAGCEFGELRKTLKSNNTLNQIIDLGVKACQEHGFSFIELYKIRDENLVMEGNDRHIISPVHVSEKEYRFVGIVRADGTTEIRFS